MEYIYRKAVREDAAEVIRLIEKRIAWMDERGIEQWNTTDYLKFYPRSYFETCAENGSLYVAAAGDGRIAGAAVLLDDDGRWEPDTDAWYIHNLVSDTGEMGRGAGSGLLRYFERLAKEQNKKALRLDCQEQNEDLNRFYERAGYVYVSDVEEGCYRGKKREKRI